MEAIQRLKCAFTTKKSLRQFYSDLPKDQLEERKTYNFQVFLSLSTVWVISWFIIVWSTKMDMPLLILYTGAILGTIISLWADYRNKVKLIDELLKLK